MIIQLFFSTMSNNPYFLKQIKIDEINVLLNGNQFYFITALGFDKRSISVINNINIDLVCSALGFCHGNNFSVLDEIKNTFTACMGIKGFICGENPDASTNIADKLLHWITTKSNEKKLPFVVDISSFSHEVLLLLVGLLKSHNFLKETLFLYTHALCYGSNDNNDIFLSSGVKSIRSVLGYMGTMLPLKHLHLIILQGFEIDRVLEVIQLYEPKLISLGHGAIQKSISADHFERNVSYCSKVENILKNELQTSNFNQFEFSCINPLDTKNTVLNIYNKFSEDYNAVICPLNNKLSTLGVALAGLKNPDIQIAYAEPLIYNTENYVTPSDILSAFSLSDSLWN